MSQPFANTVIRNIFKDQDGKDQVRETKIDYTVGTPTGAFVSAEKVKVL